MIPCGPAEVFVRNPVPNMRAFIGFTAGNTDLFPILFVTVVCGAVPGFHSLVSPGISPRVAGKECDMRPAGCAD